MNAKELLPSDEVLAQAVGDMISDAAGTLDNIVRVEGADGETQRKVVEKTILIGSLAFTLLSTAFREFEVDAELVETRALNVAIEIVETKLVEARATGDADAIALCEKALERLQGGDL
jgi:hypothetical protein